MQYHVPDSGNDMPEPRFHNCGMAKRRKEHRPGWYVAEWLRYLNMQQTALMDATGRSKGRISELVSGKQRFNEDDLAAFSRAMGVSRGFLLEVNPLSPDGALHAERGRLTPPPVPQPQPFKKKA